MLLIDYAQALWEIAMIVAVQALMLAQVSFGYYRYRLKGEVPEGVTVREDLPKDATLSIVIPAYREAATSA